MVYEKIIICGKRCTGKSTLLWDLQKQLNWPIFSISMYLRDYIRQYHLSEDDVDKMRMDISKDIDDRIRNLIGSPNNCLIEAKLFHDIKLTLPKTLKLLLVAREDVVYTRNAYREGIDLNKAKDRVLKKESSWEEKMAKIYGYSDFYDHKYYDLVVDTSDLSREAVTKRVVDFVAG